MIAATTFVTQFGGIRLVVRSMGGSTTDPGFGQNKIALAAACMDI